MAMDLFSWYVMFSHFTPRDATRGNSLFQMSSYARANVRIKNYARANVLKKKQKANSHEGITWSEMGKQNIQAKEVYSCFFSYSILFLIESLLSSPLFFTFNAKKSTKCQQK